MKSIEKNYKKTERGPAVICDFDDTYGLGERG